MKKVFFISLLTISISAQAQHLSIGLKAGANISNITGGDFTDVKKSAKVGFYGGAFFNFRIGKNLSLQPEALISTQGARFDDGGDKYNWTLTYLSVPVMLKYRTDGGFYFEAGPQFGYKLSEKVDGESPDEDFDSKNIDLSAGVGLGYHSSGGFGIGARYLVGLSKLGDFDASGDLNPDYKNSVIQIGISYTLGTPKKK